MKKASAVFTRRCSSKPSPSGEGGLLRKLFGAKKTDAEASAGQTVRVNQPAAATEEHVQVLGSLKTSMAHKVPEPQNDAGPWYIGKTVADIFEIRGVLGRGGMGIVYLAHDNATLRKVAVKVPLGKFVDDEDARKRFTREAEAWTGLVHPHIVHAFDVHDDKSTDYRPAIFMDYCDGGSLADRISNGSRLPMTEALDIAIQICWAMAFAHEKGHIHRDLKPANVLLTSEGKALVTDFGLVKMLAVGDLGPDSSEVGEAGGGVLASVSQVGGTPEYMAPEQWEGRAEKASDIYAFGVMLYELFCGCRPFTAENRLALRGPHLQAHPPDPKQLDGSIPDGLAELMLSCLEKQPSARPASLDDVADRLMKGYPAIAKRTKQATECPRSKPDARTVSDADKKARGWALIRLGSGCQLRGDLVDAQRHYRQSQVLFEELGDKSGLSWSLNGQGNVLGAWDRLEEALVLFKQAEQLCRELDYKAGLSVSLGKQGVVLRAWGRLEEAFALHKQEEALCRELGDKSGLSGSLDNQGRDLYALGRLEEALVCFKEHGTLCHELGNESGVAMSLGNQGVILFDQGFIEPAMELYRQQEQLCEKLQDYSGLATCYANQAELIALRVNQVNEGLAKAREAHRLATEHGLHGLLLGIEEIIQKIEKHGKG